MPRKILLTDADNTLWDTNAVYANAQLSLLDAIESILGVQLVVSDRLSFIRNADQRIAKSHEAGLAYPPRLLIRSLASFHTVTERDILQLEEIFLLQLRTSVPALRPGVHSGLEQLSRAGVELAVVTESSEERTKRTLLGHGLSHLFKDIFSGKKTLGMFSALRQLPGADFFVGDQIDVDINLARQAGFRTIFFPGDFVPEWNVGRNVEADFLVSSFAQLPQIILGLG